MANIREIDNRTLKLIVGVVAISLPILTSAFSGRSITSISASYYEGGWSQTIFVGFLFAIGAFLLAYNGLSRPEMFASKAASLSAFGVALFPCDCGGHPALVPFAHGFFAAAMFLILTYLCIVFYRRAKRKGFKQADVRAAIYVSCAAAIVIAEVVLITDKFDGGVLSRAFPRLVFYGESVGLFAFGVAWLTASRVVPLLTREDERFSPLRRTNPPDDLPQATDDAHPMPGARVTAATM
jgi:hypothetical protein